MNKKAIKPEKWAALVEIDGYQIVYRLVYQGEVGDVGENGEPLEYPYCVHADLKLVGGLISYKYEFDTKRQATAALKAAPKHAEELLKNALGAIGPLFVASKTP